MSRRYSGRIFNQGQQVIVSFTSSESPSAGESPSAAESPSAKPRFAIPLGVWGVVKEAARHVLRRPVIGIAAAARTADGRWVLVRRTDTGEWALPGGTLEWGEPLRVAIARELAEEAGVRVQELGGVAGVYSRPDRDLRFHAVTIVVHARVSEPVEPPNNPAEIAEVRLFRSTELPEHLAHGMTDMLHNARRAEVVWE